MPQPLLTAVSPCPLFPFSISPFPKLSIHSTKKSNPQAKLFTVFYESLKGRGTEKEKGWVWGQRGGCLLQRRGEERGSERKRRQACMRVPSSAKQRRKAAWGWGGSMPEPYRKQQRAEQEEPEKLKCKWTLGPPGKDYCKENTKGMPRRRHRFGGAGQLKESC